MRCLIAVPNALAQGLIDAAGGPGGSGTTVCRANADDASALRAKPFQTDPCESDTFAVELAPTATIPSRDTSEQFFFIHPCPPCSSTESTASVRQAAQLTNLTILDHADLLSREGDLTKKSRRNREF